MRCPVPSRPLSSLLFLFISLPLVVNQPVPNIRNLRARFDSQKDSIIVEWQFIRPTDHVQFTARYRIGREPNQWRYIKTSDTHVRLTLPEYRNGDNLLVQVQAERGGHVIEDWSQELVITINKKIAVGDILVDEDDLLPPLDFTAHVLGPKSVKLEWKPSNAADIKDLYYLVNVKQLTSDSGTAVHRQQIKTSVNSFSLGKLIPGERYEMTIRSGLPSGKTSATAAIVEINMPKEDDFFEIGNLIISSHFKSDGHGNVNLTWEVPPNMERKIIAYNVQYSEQGSDRWQQIQFHGRKSTATLNNLRSDTEYVLKIKTILVNNIQTESGQFKFKTPKVDANPIQKVDVIYSHEVNSVRLQWMLESFVESDRIEGYDVYLSEDKDKPDSQWRLVRLDTPEAALSLNNLKSSTTYYVRVNVRNVDGSILRAPSVYRFKTIEKATTDNEDVEGNSLAYRNTGPGQIQLSWTYPTYILDKVVGSTILYTDRKDISTEQWSRVTVNDSKNTSITLNHLREGTRYSVQIIPLLYTGENEYSAREQFEMKTDSVTGMVNDPSDLSRVQYPPSPQAKFEQLRKVEMEYMRIVSCNPDAITTGCAWDEICITRVEDRLKGWCISNFLRDSILNS